jgi:hypothetical protein
MASAPFLGHARDRASAPPRPAVVDPPGAEERAVTRLLSTGIVTGCLAAAVVAGPAQAEPKALDPAQLDGVVAGSAGGPPGTFAFDRSAQITTQIAIPVSTAVAICDMCSGNASAVAAADAIGAAQANALAMTTGQGNTLATSTSVGPFVVYLVPTGPSPGGGTGKR